MSGACIVSTAHTPLAKSWKGALNMTHGATMGAHVVRHAVTRAGVEPDEIEDVIIGCALPEGATGGNIARQIALRAGLPASVPGATVNRACASGLQAIVMAAQRIVAGEEGIYVAGGVESISCVQKRLNNHMATETWLAQYKPTIYWNMLQTAEYLGERYGIMRERQDLYGAESQQRAAVAAATGRFAEEIVPITTLTGIVDQETGRFATREVTLFADEGIRAGTTYEAVAGLRPSTSGGR